MNISHTTASASAPPTLSFAELNANPHQLYAELRSRFPFVRREDGVYIVLRARDIETLVSDPRTRQIETEMIRIRGINSGPIRDFVSYSMLFSNGETHRRRRQPLTRNFAFRMMAGLRPKVRALSQDLLDNAVDKGRLKLRDDYAALIPAITIAGILGIPRSDVPLFTTLAYEVARILTTSWTTEDIPGIEAATRELTDYCARLIAERRKLPRNDFLSEYVAKIDETPELSPIEAVMQIVSVVLGGSDTTRAAIVIQTGLLLERPHLWEAMRSDPQMIVPAVAEALRYEPAVGSIPRLTLEDVLLDGHVIPKGGPMSLSTLSGLRDPAVFDNPDAFDPQREQPRWHPVFGGGEHRCLGEALARIELEEALTTLTTSQLQFGLGSQPLRIHGHAAIRKVDELEIECR
ncbi:cytochrome P450 [Rhizobium sp. 0TCS1.26]|uniref:cytochrome P450 n=1 Tax=Rhizobium sp. 0TCS1.26 TaxID=3142623 RepID=UPI003D2D4469